MDKKRDIEAENVEKESIMHSMENKHKKSLFSPVGLIVFSVAIILGIGTGFLLVRSSNSSVTTNTAGGDTITKGTIVGSNDTKTFKDQVEGVLEEGGVEGEGQFHLVRPGGVSQNVYLTSSSVDLSQFIKKKVRVWGETQKAQKAGWLMDVGRVEVL